MRERQTQARAISVQMRRLFLPLDEEVSCRLTDSGKMLLDVAHLIDRKCVERYQSKFASTSATLRECHMQLSGPWPPYHFVHRLTRTAHSQTQPAAVVRAQVVHAQQAVPVSTLLLHLSEPLPAMA
jgi:hypothetical protein